jgi:superoxide dismutase
VIWAAVMRRHSHNPDVMVGYDLNDGSLFNYVMDTQNPWAVYNMCPVLALDVYEHAYMRDFGATPDGRKQYVEASSPTSTGTM